MQYIVRYCYSDEYELGEAIERLHKEYEVKSYSTWTNKYGYLMGVIVMGSRP